MSIFSSRPHRGVLSGSWIPVAILASLLLLGLGGGARGAPEKPLVLAVLGHAGDGGRLQAALEGARSAAAGMARTGLPAEGVQVASFDTKGTEAGVRAAVKGPTPVSQAIAAADGALAPLAARRLALVHEPTVFGRTLAAGVARTLSSHVVLAAVRVWDPDAGAAALQTLKGFEAGWIYVAMNGAPLRQFVEALATSAPATTTPNIRRRS